MSTRELKRLGVMARVEKEALNLVNAAAILGLSYRQAKRIWRRYQDEGAEGLQHRSVGRVSGRGKPKKFRLKVLRLVRQKYSGEVGERFGPTLAAEHLGSEDNMEVDPETLRRWMLADGLWSRMRKRRAHRKRREARPHFGELVQMDGSFHEWFEQRGPKGCLMNLVDDATATTLAAMGAEETIWTAAGVLRSWIEQYGVPVALYTDWKTVYVKEATEQQLLRGEAATTQFGGICQRLGIRIIAANSPQAKGRVERNHGTHQDRLVKKLRRKKIQSYAAANEYLETEYLAEHNKRFARAAAAQADYHRRRPSRTELDEAFRLETGRMIGNDWVVRHEKRLFQVKRQSRYAPSKSQVVVCEWEDGRLEIRYGSRRLCHEEIAARPAVEPPVKPRQARRMPAPPQASHPWRKDYRQMRARRGTVR